MKSRILSILIVALLTIILYGLSVLNIATADEETYRDQICQAAPDQEILIEPVEDPEPLTTYAQEVWISALEWCESNGDPTAINEVDLDGTSSYYSFQFKPGTFRYLGEAYGVIPKRHTNAEIMELIKDTELQRAIVRHMVKDTSTIWENQFPGCVRKLGRPPQY